MTPVACDKLMIDTQIDRLIDQDTAIINIATQRNTLKNTINKQKCKSKHIQVTHRKTGKIKQRNNRK